MKTIFNEHLLPLDAVKLNKLIDDAMQRRRFFNITFSVTNIEDKTVYIRTTQSKPFNGNIMPVKKMVESTRNLFSEYLKGYTIHVSAVPYSPSPPDIVDSEWVLKQMNKHEQSLKDLVALTGIDKGTLSGLVNGKRPLSQPVRAMFYYIFEFMENAYLPSTRKKS